MQSLALFVPIKSKDLGFEVSYTFFFLLSRCLWCCFDLLAQFLSGSGPSARA